MRIALALAAIATLSACNGQSGGSRGVPGTASADGQTLDFAVADFDEVSLRGPDNVEVTIGDTFSVRAEGDAEALEDLEIEVRGTVLRIGRKDDSYFGIGDNAGRVTVHVTMPVIRGASVAGSGDMSVASAEADDFEASVAGSGNLAIAALTATNAEFDIAGSGDIRAVGTTDAIEISIAGSGGVEIGELRARSIEVSIAGSGDVTAFATETVDASIIGSGDVRVRGGARCNSDSFGSGDLTCS